MSVRQRSRMPPFACQIRFAKTPPRLLLASALGFRVAAASASSQPRRQALSRSDHRRADLQAGVTPHMDLSRPAAGRHGRRPGAAGGLDHADIILEQRELVEQLIGREAHAPAHLLVLHADGAGLHEPSRLRPVRLRQHGRALALPRRLAASCIDLETALFARGRPRLHGRHEPLRGQAQSPSQRPWLPVLDRLRPFRAGARRSRRDPADQAGIPHPRLGFFGVIDERMDVDLLAEVAELRPRLAVRDDRPGREDRPRDPAAPRQHPLARRQVLQGAAALSRRLGCRLHALRAQRVDEVHQPDQDARVPGRRRSGRLDADHRRGPALRREGSRRDRARRRGGRRARPRPSWRGRGSAWLAKVDRHLAAGSWDKTWAAMHKLMLDASGDGDRIDRPPRRFPFMPRRLRSEVCECTIG